MTYLTSDSKSLLMYQIISTSVYVAVTVVNFDSNEELKKRVAKW